MPINIAPSTIPNGFVIDEILGNLFGFGSVVKGNGDFDGDGFNDFLISAPGAGLGQLYVVFGSNDLTTSSTLAQMTSLLVILLLATQIIKVKLMSFMVI